MVSVTTATLEETQGKRFQIFENPMILDSVFLWLPFQDLLSVSFLNRIWRGSARRELRKRRCFFSLHNLNADLCQHLMSVNELLKTSTDIPFGGFCSGRFLLERPPCHEERCVRVEDQVPPDVFAELLNRIKFKFLRVAPPPDLCLPALTFIKEILKQKSNELEVLEISSYPCPEYGSLQNNKVSTYPLDLGLIDNQTFAPVCNLPKLIKLIFQASDFFHLPPDMSTLVRSLLLVAPNIKELHGDRGVFENTNMVLRYPNDKLHSFRELHYYNKSITNDHIIRILEAQPKFLSAYVGLPDSEGEDANCRVEYACRLLLSSSWNTLTHLSCNVLTLLYLSTQFGFPCFPYIKAINIGEMEMGQKYNMFALIDLDSLFPNMEEIVLQSLGQFRFSPDSFIKSRLKGILRRETFYQCRNVTRITCDPLCLTVKILGQVFPNVREIRIAVVCPFSIPNLVTSCWDTIDTVTYPMFWEDILEEHLFGFSRAELDMYQDWDTESLAQLHIFPLGYSILDKNVTTLRTIDGLQDPSVMEVRFGHMFSKGLVNFLRAKVPGFKIIFLEVQRLRFRSAEVPEALKEFRPNEIVGRRKVDPTEENPSFFCNYYWWPPADTFEWTIRLQKPSAQ